MTFDGLNWLGVFVAFLFSFISGAIWFGPKTFYPVWMKARGISSGQLTSQQNKPTLLFGGTIVGVLIQTLTLGLIITSIQKYQSDFGILDGALIGLGLGLVLQLLPRFLTDFLVANHLKSGSLKLRMMQSISPLPEQLLRSSTNLDCLAESL
jgi:hypothetical protein